MKKPNSVAPPLPEQSTDFFLFIFFGLFLCVSLLFFALGLRSVQLQSEFKRRNPATTGVVSSYFDSMSILVSYSTAKGEEIYALPQNIHWPRPAIGRRIRLWYNPGQPQEVVAQGGMPSAMFAGILAVLVFGGTGFAGLRYAWRKRQLRHWLYQHGQRVKADFQHAYWTGWAHGRARYKVVARWEDPSSGGIYTFSRFLFGQSLLRQIEEQRFITVLLDPDDPQRYYVELPE